MIKNKELIIFSFDFPPSNGGIARLCQEIAAGMKPYYERVRVLTREKEGVNIPYNIEQVEIITLPHRRFLCEIKAIIFLSKLKNKYNCDILCGTWHPEAILSLVSGFKNVFILGHGAEFTSGSSLFRKTIWLPLYSKIILSQAKLIIANSRYTKKLVHKIAHSASCESLPLGVNHNFFKPDFTLHKDNKCLRICTVSRIEKFKGHDFVARVLSKINESHPNMVIWNVAGTGGYLNEIVKITHGLGIDEIVKFHGYVKDVDLPKFYNENDLFLLCTRESVNDVNVEGFGLVFLEAQASGIPAIGTKTGGIADAIHVDNGGWLISQDNELELYNLLINLLNSKAIVNEEGFKARKRIEEMCTWEIYCRDLAKLMN
ncbi:glycosyltransferase family 4 protein [Pedobacter aquatilis]|uniref:glycosyltransferase family 4 protein n=1 Tax=Pedobacter aquatilis TaxID=351343 RepID=UPI002931DF58|nr:glycosyltransferase family 4 protein [Pedobacter aquatilis]